MITTMMNLYYFLILIILFLSLTINVLYCSNLEFPNTHVYREKNAFLREGEGKKAFNVMIS